MKVYGKDGKFLMVDDGVNTPKPSEGELYAPVTTKELDEIRTECDFDRRDHRSVVDARVRAVPRLLGMLERTLDERDRASEKAVQLLVSATKAYARGFSDCKQAVIEEVHRVSSSAMIVHCLWLLDRLRTIEPKEQP